MKYLYLIIAVICAVVGQTFFKHGVQSANLSASLSSIVKTVFSLKILLGFLFFGASSILWLFVLQKFPLSIAFPSTAISYVIIVLVSAMLLNEPLTILKITGVLLIVIGVSVLHL